MSLFKLRGDLSSVQKLVLGLIGLIFLIGLWWGLAEAFSLQKPVLENFETRLPSSLEDGAQINIDSLNRADSIAFANATEFEKVYPLLPPPLKVVKSYPELLEKDELVSNTFTSIWLNLQGYFWAVFISVPIGFVIGLFPLFKGLFNKHIEALRYLPLTALTGLFIIWFGIENEMKIAFLAFGIIVYLLPVVIQRINEVKDVYLKTVFTLGANDWHTIKTVYFPSVMAKLMDDIRVLTAISWTYIIIAELVNRQGGIGSLIYIKARQGQIHKVFAILIIIILVGFIQDRIFMFIDRRLFPHKNYSTTLNGFRESTYGIYTLLLIMTIVIIFGILWPGFSSIASMLVPILVISAIVIIAYGEFKIFKSAKLNG